jgi:hypothetical protein
MADGNMTKLQPQQENGGDSDGGAYDEEDGRAGEESKQE